ncbi:MAG: hypothetical protein L0Y72_21180 [Gemmataceae bacterium]|nr:hypothetical protein [Gemmataceae bacterium]MCI0741556.1 hypothetical protein [Gemmataceae bacterium]
MRRRRWASFPLLLLLVGGCRHLGLGGECAEPSVIVTETAGPSCPPAQLGPPCFDRPAPKTVFVRGPQQKIIIEREAPSKERHGAPLGERGPERVGMMQDVILVPRTVYVPYVAQTPIQAARLLGPAVEAEEPSLRQPLKSVGPKDEDKERLGAPQPCPTECDPTTIIEIRQMNQRIDRLHRILERLCAPHR